MSRIPQPFIDDLLNRVDIVDIVDKRVKLKKTGKNFSACCPFHNEKTPSFTVSQDKQFYYCFGCGATGNAIGFVMEFDKIGFVDSVEMLASSAGLNVPKEERSPNAVKNEQSFKTYFNLLDNCNQYFQDQLRQHNNRDKAVSYLKNRGLSGQIAKQFQIGYAPPGWDNLLQKFGLSPEDHKALNTVGMVIENEDGTKRYDRFRDRIMFPILDIRGRTIGFGGRVLGEENRVGPDGKKLKGSGPKYLNSPETPVFHKGKELYGLYQARRANRELKHLLVVEGYMDVIALAQFGINNTVATLGTACGEDHLRLALKYTSTIVFCFDGDKAGRLAAKRALENSLPVMTDGYQIKFLFLPEGQDPDSLVRQIGSERFGELIQQGSPLEEFFFDALSEGINTNTMEGRARLSKLAAPLLNILPKSVYRELMFELLAQRTGLSQDILQELIKEPAPRIAPRPEERSSEPDFTEAPSTPLYPNPPTQARSSIINKNHKNKEDKQNAPPIIENASRATKSSPKGPIRLAIELLLKNPDLIHEVREFSLPLTAENEQLLRLMDYLKQRRGIHFGIIIGAWKGQHGVAAGDALLAEIANDLVDNAKRSSHFDERQELHDALTKLEQQANERERRRILGELQAKPLNMLTPEEKSKIIELLQAKGFVH